MTNAILAVSVGSVVLTVVAFVGGVVFSYLFLRANPNKKAQLDKEVAKLKERTDL